MPYDSNFDRAWNNVRALTDHFAQNAALYLSPQFQEAEVRKYFIDKLFKAIGWDVDHERNPNPYQSEVRIETPERAARGRADYAFSVAPHFHRVRFFVEAKRPQSRIDSADNCFQVIRYSWPKGLQIAVLTDFNALHVVDCRFRPNINTAASRVVRSWSYLDYRDRAKFAEFYYLFSREAVANGAVETFAANELPTVAAAIKQYTLFADEARDFDDDFLGQLDAWRLGLARAFKHTRGELTSEQLTECAQRTLDRLLFTRFLEDKGIEATAIVQRFGTGKRTAWEDFVATSRNLDRIYNGIVFKPHSTLDDPRFAPDAGVFQSICDELTDSHSPYNFDSIPVEILGRVYERFLGKVVRAGAQRVRIVEKESVRKAGGVYYTPEYIVAYMVEQALRDRVENKSAKDILELRVIDTSCGSGSFLVGVFDYLLQNLTSYWQRQSRVPSGILGMRDGRAHLTLNYKRRVLVKCIYGVDVDPQAVEVAQLSLYLKLMEDETPYSANQQMEISEALLPSLARNVLMGNALTDLSSSSHDLFAPQVLAKVRPLNFRATFPAVFSGGGFDLVIGNPPYIKEFTNRAAFDYTRDSPYYQGKMDIWYLFACHGLDLVKDEIGRLAFIATNNWTTNSGAKTLRAKIASDGRIRQLVDFGDFKVFRDAGIQTAILIVSHSSTPAHYTFDYRKLTGKKRTLQDAEGLMQTASGAGRVYLSAAIDRTHPGGDPLTFSDPAIDRVLGKIRAGRNFTLDGRGEIAQGIVAPQDRLNAAGVAKLGGAVPLGTGIFNLMDDELQALCPSAQERELIKPFYTSKELGRYAGQRSNSQWIIYTDSRFKRRVAMKPYPNLKRHLDQFSKVITSGNRPYGLHRARDEKFFLGPKITSLRKCARPTFSFTDFPCYVSQSFNVIKTTRVDLLFLTGLLNCRVVWFWLKYRGKLQGENLQVDKEPLEGIPLHVPNTTVQQQIAVLVQQIMDVQLSKNRAMTDTDMDLVARAVTQGEREVDAVMYTLYGLDQTDIDVIEHALSGGRAASTADALTGT